MQNIPKSYERLTSLIEESDEFKKSTTSQEEVRIYRPRNDDSVFARIAKLNKQWQSGLLNDEQID